MAETLSTPPVPEALPEKSLTFAALRAANVARLPLFKNRRGGPAHSQPDGSDWSLGEWCNAVLGELGEAANLIKKVKRGDMTLDEARPELAKEYADVATYLDILAFRSGVDLGAVTAAKWDEVSERVGVSLRIADFDRLDAPERETRDAFVAALIETMVLTGDDAEDAENHPNEVLLPMIAAWRNDRIALTARAEQAERERANLRGYLRWCAARGGAEPVTYGSRLPECVGGLAYYTIAPPSGCTVGPARTFEEALDAAVERYIASRGSADHA